MAGKNTSKVIHKSRIAHMVNPIVIENDEWDQLELISSFKFTSRKREEITYRLSSIVDYQNLKNISAKDRLDIKNEVTTARIENIKEKNISVTFQDIKRTLEHISKLAPDKALEAYNNCDISTEAYIYGYARIILKTELMPHQITGDLVIESAMGLLKDNEILPKNIGGRPQNSYRNNLADYCCDLWIEIGNDIKNYAWGETTSPMLSFTKVIFECADIDNEHTESAIYELLEISINEIEKR